MLDLFSSGKQLINGEFQNAEFKSSAKKNESSEQFDLDIPGEDRKMRRSPRIQEKGGINV